MQIIDPGHKYLLQNFQSEDSQEISFIKKENLGTPEEIVTPGTTNEEVLEVLIDRIKFLNEKLPSRENTIAIMKLETALHILNRRTEDRVERGVEGTSAA